MKNRPSFWYGFLLVSGAAVLAKLLSAIYRIPFQNMVGDVGFYVYQQTYPLYGIMAVLAMYGFPVVLSKQLAGLKQADRQQAREVVSIFFYSQLFGALLGWIALFSLAEPLAALMGDRGLTGPIRAISFLILLLPALCTSRGYDQGRGELGSTAASHMIEQLVRVGSILAITIWLLHSGADVYEIGTGAALGSILGVLTGFLVLQLLNKGAWLRQLILPQQLPWRRLRKQLTALWSQALLISMSALVFILFQLVDALTVIRLLAGNGLQEQAAYAAKGVYDRGQPLLQLGVVLATVLSLAIVPLVANMVAKKRGKRAAMYQYLCYRLALLVGGAATVGLLVIIEPTNHMLFTDRTGSEVLRVVALAIVAGSLFSTLAGILQGYHLEHYAALAVGIGLAIKTIGNIVLIPAFGTFGAAWSTVAALTVMVIYAVGVLRRHQLFFFGRGKVYFWIGGVLLAMGMLTLAWREAAGLLIPDSRLGDAVVALSTAGFGALVVAAGVIYFPIFSEQEWRTIPKVKRIRRLVKRSG
ncbi:putative polysaccharide biosynthesis protein [Halalkalibacter oceani]|uniref:putative polysaccharide biosynthesis protein n=1 Tax=Halalkalibacter oceani TaxID=1653776 RepID=UPI003390FB6D